ncbi:hypothetical protein NC653_022841 [Populus alba x Populus x berolinensis]|uniref:Uncharacterized protein n=1 Tax=Populus alba x Populus x berolinensis TaxID=444605 RepID=A0AAD6MFN1_9ROSI|nr:hypothetical protein NC653_022841 [Populus alba x Populus x berolinensis]
MEAVKMGIQTRVASTTRVVPFSWTAYSDTYCYFSNVRRQRLLDGDWDRTHSCL